MKLSSKIHLYSSVLMAIILVVMNLSVYYVFSKMALDSQMAQAEVEASSIAQGVARSSRSIPIGDLLRSYVPANGKIQFVPADPSAGSPSVTSSGEDMEELRVPYSTDKQVRQIQYEGTRYVLVSLPVIWNDGTVSNIQISRSLAATMETLQVLRIVLLAVTAIALIPIIVSTRVLGRLIMQPITVLTRTMQDIRHSGRFRRIELKQSSKDELFEMGSAFNDMITLLESNYAKQEQFVSNASHELKTPLTIIESYASLLKRRGLGRPELFQESVEAIHSEAIRMKEMTEQLLLLARNPEDWQVEMERVDLVALTKSSAKAFHDAYNRQVEVKAEATMMGWTDSRRLKQLLFILLDNALKYSDELIVIEVVRKQSEIHVQITDRGIGIPRDELERVFDRFYRVDEARSRRGGGAGLGLSLALDIAQAISAQIELDSLPGVGTTATIRIQAAP